MVLPCGHVGRRRRVLGRRCPRGCARWPPTPAAPRRTGGAAAGTPEGAGAGASGCGALCLAQLSRAAVPDSGPGRRADPQALRGGVRRYVSGGWDRGSVAAARPDAPRAEPRRRATRLGARAALARRLRARGLAPEAAGLGAHPAPRRAGARSRPRSCARSRLQVFPGWSGGGTRGSAGRQRSGGGREQRGRHQAAWLGPHRLQRLPGPELRAPPGPLGLGRVGGGRPWAPTPFLRPKSLQRAKAAAWSPLCLCLLSLALALFSVGACEVMI